MLIFCAAVYFLARRLVVVIKQARHHREEFEAFDAMLRAQIPEQVTEWEKMLHEWEQDHEKPCPYIPSTKRACMSLVLLYTNIMA